ncbi:MAG: hypothetical protein HYT64_02770 [Candidatus Yanofskybacteria bacterium]|nr:hypothetical protein [Candidatus Yanofskybacteria bacterium]
MVTLHKYKNLAFSIALFALLPAFSYAADFNIYPQAGTFGSKQEFEINLKIDSAGETVNAAQAKLKFSPNIIEVKSISKDGSIFNFWLQEPKLSNTDGTIEFIGGTPSGFSGSSLQVLKIIFTAKGVGQSDISFVDASITAADGSGTNVLSKSNGANLVISSVSSVPKPESAPILTPAPIIRKPTQAAGLPATPEVSISLYPNSANWYNFVSQFTPSWKLPSDISGLNTALNTNPNFTVPPVSEGLFESETFPAITKDGIYYFHIRFQNNKGWGPTAHYRIAVDSQPPVPFKIDVKTGLASDDPSPKLSFNVADSLSGIDRYEVVINSGKPIVINNPEYSFLPSPPGQYTARVRAYDKAGNSVEDRIQIEILPIEMPSVGFITKKMVLGSDILFDVKGSAIPDTSVIITIEDDDQLLVLQTESRVDVRGEWEFRLDRELRRGDYFVTVKAKDSRGALSLPTDPIKISYAEKAVISFFGLDITLSGLIIILVIASMAAAVWFYREALLHLARSQRESVIISRDLRNAFNIIKEDLDKIAVIVKKDASVDAKALELDVVSKKIKGTLNKIEEYSSKDIEKLR